MIRGKWLSIFCVTLLFLSFQNCGRISNSEITSESADELWNNAPTTVRVDSIQAPIKFRDLRTGFQLNVAFDSKGTERLLSPYLGPLAIGTTEDYWNSAGKSDWPVTPISLDNSRADLITADGAQMPGTSLRVQNLGQAWELSASSGIQLLPYTRYHYTDLPRNGLVTLSGLPAGEFDVLAYGPPGAAYPNSFSVSVLTKDDQPAFSTPLITISKSDEDANLKMFVQGIHFAKFVVRLRSGEKLQIMTDGPKKSIAAMQITMRPEN